MTGTDIETPSSLSHRQVLVSVFRLLLIEEWRLHTWLFGGWRFAIFPLIVAGFAAAAGVGLSSTGTSDGTILLGVHVLVLGFGLYSGTAGFAGSDMLENLVGDLSLLLGAAGTLPITRRYLLGLFLVKDALFYAVVFVLPVAVAMTLTIGGFGPLWFGAVWASLSLVFVFGMSVTVTGIAARSRGLPLSVFGLGLLALAAAAWVTGSSDLARTIVVPLEVGASGVLLITVGTLVIATGGLLAFDPARATPSQTIGHRYPTVPGGLPLTDDDLVRKTLLDLARSTGGWWKPVVSVAILFVLVAAMVGVVASITGLRPAPGIFFGGVLGLSAFTTYNWLTQFDAVEEYLIYPVSIEDVFRAKRTAFVIVCAPTVIPPYLLAVYWFDATLLDAVVGAVVLAGLATYYYGLTVYVAGFEPNEFLFDSLRFGAFAVGVAAVLLPTLLLGFVVVPPTTAAAVAVGALAVGAAVVGVLLTERAGPRWARRYRG